MSKWGSLSESIQEMQRLKHCPHPSLNLVYNHTQSPKSCITFLLLLRVNMILSIFYLLGLQALAHAAPEVQLGNTKLLGRDITGFKLDFFGGMIFAIFLCVVRGSTSRL